MLWVLFFVLSAVAAIPVVISFARAGAGRGRRQAALALHRAQLVELDRERAQDRIGTEEHQAAVLEVKRRLLRVDAEKERASGGRVGWGVLAAVLIAVPIAALVLYLPAGDPGLPAAPFAPRLKAERAQQMDVARLVTELQQRLATLDPKSEEARKGFVLLGQAEASRGNFSAAASAWRKALADRFDPALAAVTAEAETRAAGHVDGQALALFKSALAKAPADAPWRALVKQRLAEAGVR